MKLISMTDFVLKQRQIQIRPTEVARLSVNYAEFLKQPLTLEMFIPCDEEGNVLEEPKESNYNLGDIHAGYYRKDLTKYQQAKERVLFDGLRKMTFTSISGEKVIKYGKDINFNHESIFGIRNNEVKIFYENIESIIHFDLTLTQTAIKQIGL